MEERIRRLVSALCSEACGGRRPATPGGLAARALVKAALDEAGLPVEEQLIPGHGGANLLGALPGTSERWVVVGAHYDHLGPEDARLYAGADDNAAAVAILVEVARALAAQRPSGRGVLFAAFDAEEPPCFLSPTMGSEYFARHPTVPLERVDAMICIDTPEKLDYPKMAATARWLTRFVRASCARPERSVAFRDHPDDLSTLRSLLEMTDALPQAASLGELARALMARCDAEGRLPPGSRIHLQGLIGTIESSLS